MFHVYNPFFFFLFHPFCLTQRSITFILCNDSTRVVSRRMKANKQDEKQLDPLCRFRLSRIFFASVSLVLVFLVLYLFSLFFYVFVCCCSCLCVSVFACLSLFLFLIHSLCLFVSCLSLSLFVCLSLIFSLPLPLSSFLSILHCL